MRITHKDALENSSLRQSYLDELVKESEKQFPDVSEFRYISSEEAEKMKDRLVRTGEEDLKMITATCTPNGEIGNTSSSIYFTENNFSPGIRKLYSAGIPSQDFHIVQGIEVSVHEAAHSEHFARGIEGFSLEEFNLETNGGNLLFLIASEIDAHRKHIRALGETKPKSMYPKEYQRFLVGVFQGYMKSLRVLSDNRAVDEKLARKIFEHYKELGFNQLF